MKIKTIIFATLAMALSAGFTSCTSDDNTDDSIAFMASVKAPTRPQERNALVEVFTGVKDADCAAGHRTLNGLLITHPGRIFGFNIHAGICADNTYTTDFGTELLTQSYLCQYPAGTVNRHVFETLSQDTNNHGTAIYYPYWPNACDMVMIQTATANIDAVAELDTVSRQLKVGVAVYYLEDDTLHETHKINVALVEDSVWGTQEGGAVQNPSQYDFNTGKYCHMHMLRHLVSGQWGEDIVPVAGKQLRKMFQYTVPQQISNTDVNLKHLKIIVFLTEDQQEVINVCQARLSLVKKRWPETSFLISLN